MAWVNNNKKNARFNPNRRDDRLMMSQVTSRREHKPRREAEPEIELVSTDPSHVLGMGAETRLDWLQMGLMQASMGKLKVDALYNVLTNPEFGPSEGPSRKALRALVLANLHLFSLKQKKAIQEAVGAWGSSGSSAARKAAKNGEHRERDRSRSRSRGGEGASEKEEPKGTKERGGGGRGSSSDSSSGGSRERRRRTSRSRHRSRSRGERRRR